MKINDINDLGVMVISLVLTIVLLITGCGVDTVNDDAESENNYEVKYMQEYYSFDFYVDKETCVEYIVFKSQNKGNVIPRLNSDGTIKLNENCLKKL